MRKLIAIVCLMFAWVAVPAARGASGPPFTLMINRTNYHVASPTNFWDSNIFGGTGITLNFSNVDGGRTLLIWNDNPTPGVGSVVVMSNGVPYVTNGSLNFVPGPNVAISVSNLNPVSADVYITASGGSGTITNAANYDTNNVGVFLDVLGGTIRFNTFNTNQFANDNYVISIENNAFVTNLNVGDKLRATNIYTTQLRVGGDFILGTNHGAILGNGAETNFVPNAFMWADSLGVVEITTTNVSGGTNLTSTTLHLGSEWFGSGIGFEATGGSNNVLLIKRVSDAAWAPIFMGTLTNYGNSYVSGTNFVSTFVMTNAASDGYVMTSDAAGRGTWQASAGGNSLLLEDGTPLDLE